jgi:hypothetical protein
MSRFMLGRVDWTFLRPAEHTCRYVTRDAVRILWSMVRPDLSAVARLLGIAILIAAVLAAVWSLFGAVQRLAADES